MMVIRQGELLWLEKISSINSSREIQDMRALIEVFPLDCEPISTTKITSRVARNVL